MMIEFEEQKKKLSQKCKTCGDILVIDNERSELISDQKKEIAIRCCLIKIDKKTGNTYAKCKRCKTDNLLNNVKGQIVNI